MGEEATTHHRLPVDLDLPRLQVPPEDGRSRAATSTGSTTTSALRVGDRVLEPAARRPGSTEYHFIDWLREHSPEDELAVLKLADELGEGYVDWYPFEHPQLGPVEIGGWDLVRFWFNPPLSRLEEEVKPHADFAVYLALVSPRLEIRSFESEPVADGRVPAPARARERRLAADERDREGARAEGGAADRGRARDPRRRAYRERQGARGGRTARRPRRAAPGHVVGHRPLDRGAHARRVGDRGERRRARSRSSRATSAPEPPAPSSCSRIAPARRVRPRPAWSTCSVVCSIPNSVSSRRSSSRRRPWQSSPGRTRTCADSAGKPDVIVHTWRSCTSTTPGRRREPTAERGRVDSPRRRLEEDRRRVAQDRPRAREDEEPDEDAHERVRLDPARREDHDRRDGDADRTEEIGEDVSEGSLDVEAVAART